MKNKQTKTMEGKKKEWKKLGSEMKEKEMNKKEETGL